MKAGGGAKRNATLEHGTQVSMATQKAANTTRPHHSEKLSGDAYQSQQRVGRVRGKLQHKVRFGVRKNCLTSQSEYMSSEAR